MMKQNRKFETHMILKIKNFSLIELLIVIGILGALSMLLLPMFHDTGKEAKDTVARSRMKDIQRAFCRFHADLLADLRKNDMDEGETTNFYLEDIARYGLWPLFVRNHPVRTEGTEWSGTTFRRYSLYDPETGFGWRGQYLEYDGIAEIAAPDLCYAFTGSGDAMVITRTGGQSAGDVCRIPVLRDPYGGYYRVLCPEARAESAGGTNLSRSERLKRMVIVCTGPNRQLETTTASFLETTDENYIRSLNGDDITARGDDTVIRLIPTNN